MENVMQENTKLIAPPDHEAYLAALEELTLELQQATTAVSMGALADFEASLVRQRMYCTRLAELASRRSANAADMPSARSFSAELMLTDRLETATLALGTATRRYSTLLKHFSETARIFAGMFRGYGGFTNAAVRSQRSQSSWSCQL